MEKLRKIITVILCVITAACFLSACSTPEIPPSGNEGGEGDGGGAVTPPKPAYTRDGELIYFGSYPRSVKLQSVIIPTATLLLTF